MFKENKNETINRLIDNSILKKQRKATKRDYIGGSRIGVECLRALYYEATAEEKDYDFEAKILKIFQTGHLYEDLAAKWIKSGGFDLHTDDGYGRQFGFSEFDGRIKGHCDGIIKDGPEGFNYPMLWECKSMKSTSWNALVKNGLKKENQVYYAQVMIYMNFFKLNECMFTAVNKDTSEMYHEIIKFEKTEAHKNIEKAKLLLKLIDNEQLPPREYSSKTFFKCKFCAWRDKCWEKK